MSRITTGVDEDELERVARELWVIGRSASVHTALAVGKLIFERIFRADLRAVRAGRAHPSFRKLAGMPGLPFGVTTLWRSVALYEMWLRTPQLFQRTELGVSHYRCVTSLPPELQERLLTQAADEGWSKSQLEAHVSILYRSTRKPRRTSRPAPARLGALHQQIVRLHSMLDVEPLPDDSEAVRTALRELREACERLVNQLAARCPAFPRGNTERLEPLAAGAP
jgi:hypothetical protein